MEFFDKVVLPQSAEHIQLLHYLMIIIQFLFIPFLSIVFAGTFLSLKYWKKGLREKNHLYIQLSEDILSIITVNKSFGVVLGILPLIISILIYAQLLHKSGSAAVIILLVTFPLITLGLILVYTFRYSFSFQEIFHSLRSVEKVDQSLKDQIVKIERGSNSLARKSGIIGFALLVVGSWYYISAISHGVFSEYWQRGNQLSILFSTQSVLGFIQFLIAAFAVTGGVILFEFFYWEGGKEGKSDEYKNLVTKVFLTITSVSLILLPVVLFINFFLLPKASLSGSVFIYSVIAIGLIFLAYHFLYAISQTSQMKMSGQLFFVIIFAVLAIIIRDQMAMSNSSKYHSAVLAEEYNKYISELKGESTAGLKVRSGEEIYTVICSACHKFDEKLVGPPYNKVLVKYEGKMDQLVAFILNPVKVDPAYPPMPNQGLRRDEAKNVAEYLMEQHLKSAGKQ